MKKYLMTGIAALAMCAAFTSCSKDPGFDQTTPEQLAQAQYDAAFIKAFGQPAANQDWGFGTKLTRGSASGTQVLKHDMVSQGYPIEREPAALVEAHDGYKSERQFVTEWFQNNPGLTPEGLDIENFFLQYVSGDDSNKPGNWYNPNGTLKQEFTANGQMDYLVVGESMTDNVHVLDFNAKSGGPFGVIYIKNGSALTFGYHSSYGEAQYSPTNDGCYYDFKLAKIDVPGVGEGWYVGLSLYAKKYDNGIQILGEQRHNYAEDWILKIIPDEPVSEPNYRVIAEDLNASEKTDFDFNDVVFDVIPNEAKNAAKIVLRAAGGIYKLTVGGREVHEAFGESADANGLYPMINTNPWNPEVKATLFEDYVGDFSDANIRNTIKNIEIKVYKPGFEENGIELTATTGKPACKILVDDTFGVVRERFGIADEYNDFTTYVQGYFDGDFWWKSGTLQ